MSTKLWLKPLIQLVRKCEFKEACALSEFLPITLEAKLIRCAAYLGQYQISEAASLLEMFPSEDKKIIGVFASLFVKKDPNLLDMAFQIAQQKYLRLSLLCLDAYLYKYPNELEGIFELTENCLLKGSSSDDFDIGVVFLIQALGGPWETIKEYTEIALSSRQSKNTQLLSNFTGHLLTEMLNHLPEKNLGHKLKIMKLLTDNT